MEAGSPTAVSGPPTPPPWWSAWVPPARTEGTEADDESHGPQAAETFRDSDGSDPLHERLRHASTVSANGTLVERSAPGAFFHGTPSTWRTHPPDRRRLAGPPAPPLACLGRPPAGRHPEIGARSRLSRRRQDPAP